MTMKTMKTAGVPSGRRHQSEHHHGMSLKGLPSMGNILYIHSLLSLSRYIVRERGFGLIPHQQGVAGSLST